MSSRKRVPDTIQADVLVKSRRRCCVCFGLNRDDTRKKGQIVHLDGDPKNNCPENLAFLCFEHHDEYDSTTSQSKGLTRAEVERYREELTDHYGGWGNRQRDGLLNFLAFSIDLDAMTDAAIRVGASVVFYGEEHAFDVLISDAVEYCDGDLYVPHLIALDHFASWGWLTYTEEERDINGEKRFFIKVERKRTCDDVAARILKRRRGKNQDVDPLLQLARHRGWTEPPDDYRGPN
jgi:hypothetical protein